MILLEHHLNHARFRDLGVMAGDGLVLGRHDGCIEGHTAPSYFIHLGLRTYTSLDLDGGDLAVSLDDDLAAYAHEFDTVYNLGTIEHVWDAHRAWSNALRMVRVGGHLLTHSPCGGYEGHGVHVTDWRFIQSFAIENGAVPIAEWFTRQDGSTSGEPSRGSGCIVYWAAYRKVSHRNRLDEYYRPQQVFAAGAVCR